MSSRFQRIRAIALYLFMPIALIALAGCQSNAKEDWGSFEWDTETNILKGDGLVGAYAADKIADAIKGYETCPPELTEMGEVACQVRLATGGSARERAAGERSPLEGAMNAKANKERAYLGAGVQVAGIAAKVLLGTAIADAGKDVLTALIERKNHQEIAFGDVTADGQSELLFQMPLDGSQAGKAAGDLQQAFGPLVGRDDLSNQDDGIGGQPLFEFPRGNTTVEEGGTVEEAAPTITSNPVEDVQGSASLFGRE